MEEDVKSLGDYLEIAKRRKYYFLTPFVIVLVGAVITAFLISPVYRSEGVILVESQQIPTDFIRSTITSYAEERVQIIEQRVMTRENLLGIIEKYNLFSDKIGKIPVSEIIENMRKQIFVQLVASDIQGVSGRNRSSHNLTFRIAYEDQIPAVAQNVANELVTLFLDENLKARTERATQTTNFLVSEAEKLKEMMSDIEGQVAAYKQQYQDSLPENLELNSSMLDRAQQLQREIERDIKSEEEEKSYLEVELATLQSAIPRPQESEETLTPEQNLLGLKAEYRRLSSVYGPAHPDIRKVKRQISNLEEQLKFETSGGRISHATEGSNAERLVQARISAADSNIESLRKQRRELGSRIAMLQDRIIKTPEVERSLLALERDYENIRAEYDELKSMATDANLSQSMEEQSKAERFSLLEPPLLPEKPVKPNRPKILLIGFMLSMASGAGMVFLTEMMDKSIKGTLHLVKVIKDTPLITIPFIETNEDIVKKKRKRRVIISLVICSLLLLILSVHFLYMPLETLWFKVLHRVSI